MERRSKTQVIFFFFVCVFFFKKKSFRSAPSSVKVMRPSTVPRGTGAKRVHLLFLLHALLWNFIVAMCEEKFWNLDSGRAIQGSKFGQSPAWTQQFLALDTSIGYTIRNVFTFGFAKLVILSEERQRTREASSIFVSESRSAVVRLEKLGELKAFIHDCEKEPNMEGKLCFTQSLQVCEKECLCGVFTG